MNSPQQASPGEQATLWNGPGARAWIEMQSLLDGVFKPFENLLVQETATKSARHILDVGCGTGATTLAFAQMVGTEGRVVGIDISEPMIAVARARAAHNSSTANFISADAQTHRFESASFDMITTRFGIMFFPDPVSALANLRHAATDDANLCLLVWRGAADNPFMTTAERAAAPLLPEIPARDPDAPGQFAFADPARVTRILADSGWSEIGIEPIDVACAFPESELVRYFTNLGPLSRLLHEVDEQTRTLVIEKVRGAFEPFVDRGEVRFQAACWIVRARSGRTR